MGQEAARTRQATLSACIFYPSFTTAAQPGSPAARLTYLPDSPTNHRVESYFSALDSLDADAIASYFAPEATVSIAGAAPIVGQAAIRKALVELSLRMDDLHHEPVQLFSTGNVSVFEADMNVTLADGTALRFPVTHIIRWVDGLIADARVNVYLEARLALALSAFDRTRTAYAELPSHKSMGRRTPAGRNGSSILRPCPAEA